jgi:hypothetical protein
MTRESTAASGFQKVPAASLGPGQQLFTRPTTVAGPDKFVDA